MRFLLFISFTSSTRNVLVFLFITVVLKLNNTYIYKCVINSYIYSIIFFFFLRIFFFWEFFLFWFHINSNNNDIGITFYLIFSPGFTLFSQYKILSLEYIYQVTVTWIGRKITASLVFNILLLGLSCYSTQPYVASSIGWRLVLKLGSPQNRTLYW